MMKEMEKAMEAKSCDVKHGCVEIIATLASIKDIVFHEILSEENKKDITNDLIKALNKYIKQAEDDKKKVMAENMGGMSGLMNMIKGMK